MQRRALWLIALSGCYFSPDKHREEGDFSAQEAGVDASDGAIVGLDGSIDALTPPADAGDAGDAFVDAGCTSDLQCPLAFPQCRNGDCVPCAEANDCSRFADTPNCGPAGKCVVCTADRTQLCTGSTPACDPTTNSCVQCVADADCPSEAKAACGSNRSCDVCTDDADCTRFGKVCEARTGACVECRPETETMDCKSGTACNPQTFTCGTRPRGSVTSCNPCDSDSECITDHRCIPMTFGGQQLGGRCLRRRAPNCARPYFTVLTRASVNGVPAEEYCGVDEAKTTCAAVLLFNAAKSCSSDDSCGAPGAVCETVGPIPNLCTYKCSFGAECIENISCGAAQGDKYCGGT